VSASGWPVGEKYRCAKKPAPITKDEKRPHSQERSDNDERSLHRIAVSVTWFPLFKERPVVQAEARRMFGYIDVDGRACERSGDDKRQMSEKHVPTPAR
jgi:hypothetical protein